MFRSLLRTLPSLSGNFKLACKIDHIDKTYKLNNIDVYEVSIKKCSLQPLQNKMYNRDININLTNNSYEYDICKFYNKYRDKFYDVNYIFNETDYKYWNPVINDESSVRNKDYEYGCKRLSYYNTGYQFEFYAPIYIDDSNDLPKYFDIYIHFNDYNMKILRINISNDELNSLYQYINKYILKINSNIIYFDDVNKKATYFGLDVLNGGLTSIQDNMVSILYKEQLPINQFNKIINGGFERNKLIMRQIIPLAFQFNVESLLSNEEKEIFYYTNINIKGNYIDKNNHKLSLYDIEHSTDELYINKNFNKENVMFHTSLYSLYEKQLNIYKYDNKININWNHWKLQLSDENDPYYTNININYSSINGKYGKFPNIGATKQLLLKTINTASDNKHNIEEFKNKENIDDYNYNLNQNISTWYKLLTYYEYNDLKNLKNIDFFKNKNNWFDVKNNYSYVNGILYNLNNVCVLNNIDKLDYFNLFLYPNFNIINSFGNLNSTNYIIEYSITNKFKHYFYKFSDHLFYKDESENIEKNYNSFNFINNDNIFIKSKYDLNNKQYILNKNENNVIYYDITELINYKLKDLLEEINNNDKLKDLLLNDMYCQISNINVINNIFKLIENKNEYEYTSFGNIYYKYIDDESYISLEDAPININENLNNKIIFYFKTTFISRTDLLNKTNLSKNININNLTKYEMVLTDKDIYFKDYEPLANNIYYININDINIDETLEDSPIEGYCKIETKEQFEWILTLLANQKIQNNNIYIIKNCITINEKNIKTKKYCENNNINIENLNYNDNDNNGTFNYNDELVNIYFKTKLSKVSDNIIKNINKNTTYFLYINNPIKDNIINTNTYDIINDNDNNIINNDKLFIPIFNSVFKHEDLYYQKNLIKNGNICYQYINENNETIYKLFNDNIDTEIDKEIVYLNNPQIKYKYSEEILLEDIIKKLANIIYDEINNLEENNFNNLYDKFKIILNLLIDENDYKIINDLNTKNLTTYDNIYIFINSLLNVLNKYKDIFVGKEIRKDVYSNILFEDVYSKYIISDLLNNNEINDNILNKIKNVIILNILYGKESDGIIKWRHFNNSKINDEEFNIKFYDYTNVLKYKYNVSYRTLLFNILLRKDNDDDIKNANNSLIYVDEHDKTYNEFIEIDNINSNDDEVKLNNIILLLKHIYDTNYEKFISILKDYKLELYELKNNNYFESNNDDYINIYTDDNGKTYGYIIFRPYIDNTINTFNIENSTLFNSICSYNFNEFDEYNENIFVKYFNDLVPFLKFNFFAQYLSNLNNKYNNIIIIPYKYLIEDKYYVNTNKIKINYNNIDSFSYLSDLKDYINNTELQKINNNKITDDKYIWRFSTYNLLQYKNPQIISVYRYMNFISPVFKKVNKIKTYQLKYKKFNYSFDDDNIYLNNINIHTYSPVYIFDNKNDKLYNYIINNELPDSITTEYEYEYKSFNDNSYYLLKPSFEIKVQKLLTYEQLLEYENNINTYNIFKKYINNFIKTNNNLVEENKILFLFNKYVVSHHSTSVKLNTYQNKKLYKLKYIFNII